MSDHKLGYFYESTEGPLAGAIALGKIPPDQMRAIVRSREEARIADMVRFVESADVVSRPRWFGQDIKDARELLSSINEATIEYGWIALMCCGGPDPDEEHDRERKWLCELCDGQGWRRIAGEAPGFRMAGRAKRKLEGAATRVNDLSDAERTALNTEISQLGLVRLVATPQANTRLRRLDPPDPRERPDDTTMLQAFVLGKRQDAEP